MKGKWGATAREGRREEEGRGRGTGADVCVHECVRDGVGGRDFKGRKGGRGGGGQGGRHRYCLLLLDAFAGLVAAQQGWLRLSKAGCGPTRLVAVQQVWLRPNIWLVAAQQGWLRLEPRGGPSGRVWVHAASRYPVSVLFCVFPSTFFLFLYVFSAMLPERAGLNRRDF